MGIILKSVFTMAAVIITCVSQAQQDISLFDGRSLAGWYRIVGKAGFSVEDGAIVGTAVIDSANSFLATRKEYGDFLLELDVKIESPLSNSGIQTRSHFGGLLHPNKVYGRQVEIDPSERRWSGGIYDEDRREWLYPLTLHPAAKDAFKTGIYNHFRILCIGGDTKTWINGVPVAEVIDSIDRKGFIALQVHAVKTKQEEGLKVYFRHIRIQTAGLHQEMFPADVPVVDLTKKN